MFQLVTGCAPRLSVFETGSHAFWLSPLTRVRIRVCVRMRPLWLSQGVVAFLRGDSGKASGLLIRASAEAKSLKPNPALAARLMQQWHAVKFEVLKPRVSSTTHREFHYFAFSWKRPWGGGMSRAAGEEGGL